MSRPNSPVQKKARIDGREEHAIARRTGVDSGSPVSLSDDDGYVPVLPTQMEEEMIDLTAASQSEHKDMDDDDVVDVSTSPVRGCESIFSPRSHKATPASRRARMSESHMGTINDDDNQAASSAAAALSACSPVAAGAAASSSPTAMMQLDSIPPFTSAPAPSSVPLPSPSPATPTPSPIVPPIVPAAAAAMSPSPSSPHPPHCVSSELPAFDDRQQFDLVFGHCMKIVARLSATCKCRVEVSPSLEPNFDADGDAAPACESAAITSSHSDSDSPPSIDLLSALHTSLAALHRSYRCALASFTRHTRDLRRQLDAQADDFMSIRTSLEDSVRTSTHRTEEELSRVRIEEMLAREEEMRRLRQKQVDNESEWLNERLRVEESNSHEIARLKAEAVEVANKLELLSSNSAMAMMEGESKAIETGEGELKRIRILPQSHFGGATSEEFHFRLAESQFLRMTGGMGQYHVTQVEYILNPPLLKRYHDFKKSLKARGEPVEERLTFHGTTVAAIEAIIREGFRIGGVDVRIAAGAALGHGIYSSESPAFAMGYIKDGRSCLLFTRVCPSKDSVIERDGSGVIQQLVCKTRDQIMPAYIVHYAAGARPKQKAHKGGISGLISHLPAALSKGFFGYPFGASPATVPSVSPASTTTVLSGPIILAGSPGSASALYAKPGRPPTARSNKRKRKPIAVPVPPAQEDDEDDDEEFKAALRASLA